MPPRCTRPRRSISALLRDATGAVLGIWQPDGESHWRVYFQARDCGASVEKARRLGAECNLPPTPIPGVGTVAFLADPQGGAFALMQASREGGEAG